MKLDTIVLTRISGLWDVVLGQGLEEKEVEGKYDNQLVVGESVAKVRLVTQNFGGRKGVLFVIQYLPLFKRATSALSFRYSIVIPVPVVIPRFKFKSSAGCHSSSHCSQVRFGWLARWLRCGASLPGRKVTFARGMQLLLLVLLRLLLFRLLLLFLLLLLRVHVLEGAGVVPVVGRVGGGGGTRAGGDRGLRVRSLQGGLGRGCLAGGPGGLLLIVLLLLLPGRGRLSRLLLLLGIFLVVGLLVDVAQGVGLAAGVGRGMVPGGVDVLPQGGTPGVSPVEGAARGRPARLMLPTTLA